VGLPDIGGLEVARHLHTCSRLLAVVMSSARIWPGYRALALANRPRVPGQGGTGGQICFEASFRPLMVNLRLALIGCRLGHRL
jgi:hypothetical protein